MKPSSYIINTARREIIVEKRFRGYVLETGEIKYQGKSEDLINSPDIKKAYLGE